jgi:hypothetical protein
LLERLKRVQAFVVRQAHVADVEMLAEMCVFLWPDAPPEEHLREMESSLRSVSYYGFVGLDQGGTIPFTRA